MKPVLNEVKPTRLDTFYIKATLHKSLFDNDFRFSQAEATKTQSKLLLNYANYRLKSV